MYSKGMLLNNTLKGDYVSNRGFCSCLTNIFLMFSPGLVNVFLLINGCDQTELFVIQSSTFSTGDVVFTYPLLLAFVINGWKDYRLCNIYVI